MHADWKAFLENAGAEFGANGVQHYGNLRRELSVAITGNVFADLSQLAPRVGIESVILRDPQVIIATGGRTADPAVLDDWRNWSGMQAVRNDYLVTIPGDLLVRHTPRILDGAERLCAILDKVREQGR